MVEEVRAQWEVSGSNRVGHVAMKFTRKMSEMGGRWPVQASIDKKKFHVFWVKIPIFSGFFRFQLYRVPDKRHSAKTPLPTGYLPSVLCRVQIGLCRVPLALGKATDSRSEWANAYIYNGVYQSRA